MCTSCVEVKNIGFYRTTMRYAWAMGDLGVKNIAILVIALALWVLA